MREAIARGVYTVRAALVVAVVLIIAGVAFTLAPTPVKANPAAAQKTGKPCAVCHTKPPALTAAGKKYKATGKL